MGSKDQDYNNEAPSCYDQTLQCTRRAEGRVVAEFAAANADALPQNTAWDRWWSSDADYHWASQTINRPLADDASKSKRRRVDAENSVRSRQQIIVGWELQVTFAALAGVRFFDTVKEQLAKRTQCYRTGWVPFVMAIHGWKDLSCAAGTKW